MVWNFYHQYICNLHIQIFLKIKFAQDLPFKEADLTGGSGGGGGGGKVSKLLQQDVERTLLLPPILFVPLQLIFSIFCMVI